MAIGAYEYDYADFDDTTERDPAEADCRKLRARLNMARTWIANESPTMKRERILEFIDYTLEQTARLNA